MPPIWYLLLLQERGAMRGGQGRSVMDAIHQGRTAGKREGVAMERGERIRIILVAALVAGITLLHYSTEWKVHYYHIFYQGLYFLPVMLAGFWFGLRGVLCVSLSITILYLPFAIIHWNGFSAEDFNSVMEMVLYNVVAIILGTLRDQEKAAQKRLHEAERLVEMGKAFSGLAHDLKTPLIAIGGLSRLIQKNLEENHPCQNKLDLIVKETRRLEEMIKEMLDFSRPLELHRSKEDIKKVITQCVDLISDLAQQRNVNVENRCPQDIPPVSFDASRMKQALINLLINAIDASPGGETVTVYSYLRQKRLLIEVTDHGSGIPIDKREEIFLPFFTTKRDGTGLGLPITKKIAEAHRGYVEVLGNRKTGATVRLVISIS